MAAMRAAIARMEAREANATAGASGSNPVHTGGSADTGQSASAAHPPGDDNSDHDEDGRLRAPKKKVDMSSGGIRTAMGFGKRAKRWLEIRVSPFSWPLCVANVRPLGKHSRLNDPRRT
jgi:hypothetical protein